MSQVPKYQPPQKRPSTAGNLSSTRSTQDVRFSSSVDSRSRSSSEGSKWFHKKPSMDLSVETSNRFTLLSPTTERYSPPHEVKKLEKKLLDLENQIKEKTEKEDSHSRTTVSSETSPSKYVVPAKRSVNELRQQYSTLQSKYRDLQYDNATRNRHVQMRKSSTP